MKTKSKKTPRRYVFWRKSVDDLNNQNPMSGAQYPVIDTLEHKLEEAIDMVADGKYDEVLIFELIKVVKHSTPPVTVVEFKGR